MVSLPPKIKAELYYDGDWNNVTRDVRQTSDVTVTRGYTSESTQSAEPSSASVTFDSRDYKYAPRNPESDLFGKIGRNTPMRVGVRAGSPWAEFFSGTTGGFNDEDAIYTADNATLDVTGDFDLRVELSLEDWAHSQMIAVRYNSTGDNRAWALEIVSGVPTFLWSPDGTFGSRLDVAATTTLEAYNGERLALRVTLDVDDGDSGHEVRFYVGRTVDDEEWAILGEPISGSGTTSVAAVDTELEFGSGTHFNLLPSGGSLDQMQGKAYALKLLDGIGGSTAVSMSTSDAGVGATSFTSGGLTWSLRDNAVLTNYHIRLSGEVPAWPPTRDLSGADNTVTVAPTDITRRMDAGNKPQDSALLRYINTLAPIDFWPMTDGPGVVLPASANGGKDLRYDEGSGSFGEISIPPSYGEGTIGDQVEPVVSNKAGTFATWNGRLRNEGSVAAYQKFDWFFHVDGVSESGVITLHIDDRGEGSVSDPVRSLNVVCTVYDGGDNIRIEFTTLDGSTGSYTLLATVNDAGIADGQPHYVRVELDPASPNTLWYVYLDGSLIGNGTLNGSVFTPANNMTANWGAELGGGMDKDVHFGYFMYWDSDGPTAAQVYNAWKGYPGEEHGTRLERLGSETGYSVSVSAGTTPQTALGSQDRMKLLELLEETSQANLGYLVSRRDALEMTQRSSSTLWNQYPAFTVDFSAGMISSPFAPVDDDALTENDVTVKRKDGSTPTRFELTSGDLSVQDPPNGVGRYDVEYTYNVYEDIQASDIAFMKLHLGTYNGVRYTRLTLNLANPRVHQMIDRILRADVGDKIRLTNLPKDHGPDDVDLLISGYSEVMGATAWNITFNCLPAEPWTAGVANGGAYSRMDTGGCELAEDLTETETSVDVTTTGVARWVDSSTFPDEFPFDIRVAGEVMRVTACSGTTASQTFTVVRSINGVVKSHTTGDDVRLASPIYVAL